MIFIDGGYVRRNLEVNDLNWVVDLSKFSNRAIDRLFPPPRTQNEDYIRTYYYDANYSKDDPNYEPPIHDEKYSKRKEIFDAYDKTDNVEVVLGSLIISGNKKDKDRQKRVDTKIAIDMISKAYMNHYDIAILVCGDRDYIPIVKAVKNLTGKRVYGIFFPNHCPDDLIKLFDRKLDINIGDGKPWGIRT